MVLGLKTNGMFTYFRDKAARIQGGPFRGLPPSQGRVRMRMTKPLRLVGLAATACVALTGCAGSSGPQLAPASFVSMQEGPGEEYVIGPLDKLTVHVWRNDELGAAVQVRPDGRITTPLVADMPGVAKTPTLLA